MKWVTCVEGSLCVRQADGFGGPGGASSGPGGGFAGAFGRRAVHELVFDARVDAAPMRPAVAGVRAALGERLGANGSAALRAGSAVVWCDPSGTLYPPALIAAGVPAGRLYVLRVRAADVAAVAADCLRCPGVAVVVVPLPAKVSRVQARRLQLAAEHGGGVGIVLRECGPGSDVYAAATRWAVSAAPGDRRTQRWAVRLTHGHVQGKSTGDTFWLEGSRASSDGTLDLVPVRAPAPLADHATPAPPPAATG